LNGLQILPHLTLLLSLAWAVARTKGRLRVYLAVELATTLVIEGWWFYVRDFNATSYEAIYCVMRAIELTAVLWLAQPRRLAVPFALPLLLMMFWQHSTFSRIALIEGSIFQFAWVSAMMGRPTRPMKILSAMWLLLVCFDVGYAFGWGLPEWAALNGYWTYVVCSFAFLLVGYREKVFQVWPERAERRTEAETH
jgi:hypothetical protein